MSDDRLAGIINAHYRRDDVPYVGVEDEAIDAADAIRAAVAADPSIVGMERVYGAHGIRTAHWLAPSEGEVTR